VKKIIISPNSEESIEIAADYFVNTASDSIQKRGCFSVVLSGGKTPKPLYKYLKNPAISNKINWEKVFIYWGDERNFPPDHPDSNFHLADEALLSHVPIPKRNIFRIKGELSPNNAAEDYNKTLEKFIIKINKFDLIFLGMGNDGHTASLFPGTDALYEKNTG
jgi:6-phosphogluconolactonase